MEFNNVFKLASIRSVMYNVNVRSEPRPTRPIPHFTQATYTLLNQLRSKKPNFVDGEIKVKKNRLMKINGTYFTDEEQEKHYYELDEFFEWMSERDEREKQEKQEEERWDRWDVPLTDTWRFSK